MKKTIPWVALLLVMGSAALGQVEERRRPKGLLTGRIRLPPGEQEAPEMVTVTLNALRGSLLGRQTLRGQMSFTFHDVYTGRYFVTLESPGYETVERTVEMKANITGDRYFVTVPLGKRLPEAEMNVPKGTRKTISASSLLIPEAAQQELEKARHESRKPNPEKAIEHLKKALEIHPDSYEAYNNLAVEYARLGKTTEAIASLQKSIQLSPKDATAHRNLAQLQLSQGGYQEALGHLRRSIELDPKNSKALMLLGEAYLGIGQYQLALNYFQKAARENPEEYSYLGMAQCYLQLGMYEEALKNFKAFVARKPGDPRIEGVRHMISELERRSDQHRSDQTEPRP